MNINSDIKIKITKFGDRKGILGKKVFLTDDTEGGQKLVKESIVAFSQGYFETVTTTWDKFGEVLSTLKPNETLGMGANVKANGAKNYSGTIVTALVEAKRRSAKREGEAEVFCARTLANFVWHKPPSLIHNVVMIDVDDLPQTPPMLTQPNIVKKFFNLYPEMLKLPGGCWVRASAGAYVKNIKDGYWLTELSGVHLYFALPNSIEVFDLKNYLQVQSWLSEEGRYVSSKHRFGYSLLERHFIDMSVFSPERLDFIGGSICGKGVAQERPEPEYILPDTFGSVSREIPDFSVSADEKNLADYLRQEAKLKLSSGLPPVKVEKGMEQYVAAVEAGTLPGMFPLNFDTGGRVLVWEVISHPEKFAGQTLSDPLFPEKGRCKAKYYFNEDGNSFSRHVVNSFVKGGRQFFLALDLEGAQKMISNLSETELKIRFGTNGSGWEEITALDSEIELQVLLEDLKMQGIGKLAELKAHIGKAVGNGLLEKKQAVLDQFNKRFAYVDVGSTPRIIEDTGDVILLRTRRDFLIAVENIHIPVWSKTKNCVTNAAAGVCWLQWEKKRMYDGIEFNPMVQSKEFTRDKKKIYNRFKGFSVEPTNTRACGRKACNGLGCFKWFIGDGKKRKGRFKLCPSGSWTYWLMTIHEVVTGKNKAHTRWVLDWLVDMVKNPVSGAGRPGTSLVVRGGQGTGKGSVIWPIMQILHPYTHQCDSMAEVLAAFNAFMEDIIILFADEAIWGGSRKESGKLKRLITEDTLNIQRKGVDTYQAPNFIRMYISSNGKWVVPAEDDERRYTVFNVSDTYKVNHEWFANMKGANLGELLDEIYNWDIKSDIRHNLQTEALEDQKQQGWSVYDEFLVDSLDEMRYWDSNFRAREVANTEISMLYESDYARHWTAKGLTSRMFVSRLRKKFKDAGIDIPKGQKIKHGPDWVYGFKFPHFERICAILNINSEKKKEEICV